MKTRSKINYYKYKRHAWSKTALMLLQFFCKLYATVTFLLMEGYKEIYFTNNPSNGFEEKSGCCSCAQKKTEN